MAAVLMVALLGASRARIVACLVRFRFRGEDADWLTPAWKKIADGCHLNRPIGNLIESAGYRIERLEIGYMKGPKPMTFIYEGSARRG